MLNSTKPVKVAALFVLGLFSVSAMAQSSITVPPPGDTLPGSSATFEWEHIQGATRYSLWLGTASDPDAYGRQNTIDQSLTSMTTVQLPVDGSEVLARLRWHNGTSWNSEAPISYTAGAPNSGVWGDCTATETRGRRTEIFANLETRHRRGGIGPFDNPRIHRLLRDGCASDNEYVELKELTVYPGKAEKGIYLWLAPGSGAAAVHTTRPNPIFADVRTTTKIIVPYTDRAEPVFIYLDTALDYPENYQFHISPLDHNKPVRVSEVRMALKSEDVSQLRKNRFSGSDTFAAGNGDPRARVTAEIDDLFAPDITSSEGYFANRESCGTSFFIDATWEMEQGVAVQGRTIWINFARATNAEISAAIKAGVDSGEAQFGPNSGFPYGECTRAPDSLIYQDWLGKAASALNGTYNGPAVYSDLCVAPSAGRAFEDVTFDRVDDWKYAPANLIDRCTFDGSTWSGKQGSEVTLDAGTIRAMKGIYLWSTFARAESLTIESSRDGETWRSEWSPAITEAREGPIYFPFNNRTSRYIRLGAQGSAVNDWINLDEIRWVHRNDAVVSQ